MPIGTSVAERVAAGEISLSGAAGRRVVITASSVGSPKLQADTAAKQGPVPERLVKSTEAISSSRLYSNTQTHTQNAEQRRRDKMGTEETEKTNPSKLKIQC